MIGPLLDKEDSPVLYLREGLEIRESMADTGMLFEDP